MSLLKEYLEWCLTGVVTGAVVPGDMGLLPVLRFLEATAPSVAVDTKTRGEVVLSVREKSKPLHDLRLNYLISLVRVRYYIYHIFKSQ